MKQAEHVDPEELRPFMGQWVALDQSGEQERVVGNGTTAAEAVNAAKSSGHIDACLMFVPRGTVVPTSYYLYRPKT
jgi:hypothetical protein